LYNEDLPPIFEPVTEQSKMFEKSVVNQKRFVTKVTRGTATSSYNNEVNVFELNKGLELPKEAVLKILKLSKDTVDKFNDKFNWAKSRQAQTAGYGQQEGILSTEGDDIPLGKETSTETQTQQAETQSAPKEEAPPQSEEKVFSFDDIEF